MVRMMNSELKIELEPGNSTQSFHLAAPAKRFKCDVENGKFPNSQSACNPLDEPSPLGLCLKKSPSFLDLIQVNLSHKRASSPKEKGSRRAPDKLKASNFPATLLRIGNWEYKSRYEGDLVAKCYFAKHKLVWEMLDGGLKNKIEIQWSDVMAIKAIDADDAPGTLDVVLARQPLFFRETDPQPRKHTLWKATSDFTGGQASTHRRHILECLPGLLGRHFEKLVQCDPRLNILSQRPEILPESPYFELRVSGLDEPNQPNPATEFLGGTSGAFSTPHTSSASDQQNPSCRARENSCAGNLSPCSGMDTVGLEEMRNRETKEANPDHIILPGIQESISITNLMSQINTCVSDQIASGNSVFADNPQGRAVKWEIAQHQCNDTSVSAPEELIMPWVNSLYSLPPRDSASGMNSEAESMSRLSPIARESREEEIIAAQIELEKMSREDSTGDLLLNIPRMASFPHLLSSAWEASSK